MRCQPSCLLAEMLVQLLIFVTLVCSINFLFQLEIMVFGLTAVFLGSLAVIVKAFIS